MVWQGKIEFKKPITIDGKPHGIEHVSTLPSWSLDDEGRVVHAEDTGKLWFGTASAWQELTPGGVGAHDHNDVYYTEVEVDAMFEGKSGEKQIVGWSNVNNKPTTFTPETHTHVSTAVTYDGTISGLTATNVKTAIDELDANIEALNVNAATFEALVAAGDVGPGSDQVAIGSHSHEALGISYDNTLSGLTATDVKGAIDELDGVIDGIGFSANEIDYDNTASGLSSLNVQAAIDEISASGPTGASMPVTGVLYVDSNRTDSYTEDGSFLNPYKTIGAAISNLGSKSVISLKQGSYSENITLPASIELISQGTSWYNGSIIVGDGIGGSTKLQNLTIAGQLTINVGADNTCKTSGVYVHNDGFVVLQSGNLEGDLAVDTTTINPAIEVQSGSLYSNGQRFTSAGTNVILQTGGRVVLSMSEVVGSSLSSLIESTGGTLILESTQVINTGGGLAINVNNSGNASNPNLFADIVHAGGIEVNACLLIAEGIVGGVPTTTGGGSVVYRSAQQIMFDDTNSSLGVTNIQDAVDEVFNIASITVIPQTSGIPVDTPASGVGTARFDPATSSLYIFNGTSWINLVP